MNSDWLSIYDREYRRMTGALRDMSRCRPLTRLQWAERVATFATACHTGRFADGTLESLVLQIGAEMEGWPFSAPPVAQATLAGGSQRRILHVATWVRQIGGHARTIDQWIRHDPTSRHSLLLTKQWEEPVPRWLCDSVSTSGGQTVLVPESLQPMARAKWLRTIARESADVVILHHCGEDLVPLLAFADHGGPPVAVLNHADQMFWAGSSIADLVIDLREVGRRLSYERRSIRRAALLPIPLSDQSDIPSKASARAQLSIPADRLVLLSVGRPEKFRPTSNRNFFATMDKVLVRVPDAHLYIAGMGEDDWDRQIGTTRHERIHLCGKPPTATLYQAAADLFLESFPWGSATALLEAAATGAACVLQYAPEHDILAINHELNDLLQNAADETQYLSLICRLCENESERRELGKALQAHVHEHHIGQGWRRHLESVYQELDGLTHEPAMIPPGECVGSPIDRVLSDWNAIHRGHAASAASHARRTLNGASDLFDLAFHSRQQGFYAESLRILLSCITRWGPQGKAFKAMAKLPVHWAVKRFTSRRPLNWLRSVPDDYAQ